MNGNIDLAEVDEKSFLEKDEATQNWLLFIAVRNLSHQPERCQKKFVTRVQAIVAGALFLGFCLGAGWLTISQVVAMVK